MGGKTRTLLYAALVGLLALVAVGVTVRRLAFRRPPRHGAKEELALKRLAPPPDELRARAIRQTLKVMEGECRVAAGGDWDLWEKQLAPFRESLQKRVQAAKPLNPTAKGSFEARSSVLEARDDFPLFESAPVHYTRHIMEPESLEAFRKANSVSVGARWLKSRGIDLIFVAVPKMTDVYPNHFADHCPADRIVSIRLRRILLELLEQDVEVVDLLPAFLAESEKEGEVLYQSADPHWAPRAQALAAGMVGDRLKRYPFIQEALDRPACYRAAPSPYRPASHGACYPALTERQRQIAEKAQPKTFLLINNLEGHEFYSETAPVLVIGDSYNNGFHELLGKEINLALRCRNGGGQTTQAFKDMLRDPAQLEGVRVVVWLVCCSSFELPWPMPQPILDAVKPRTAPGRSTQPAM